MELISVASNVFFERIVFKIKPPITGIESEGREMALLPTTFSLHMLDMPLDALFALQFVSVS
jgi:hypothetical protein